MCAAGACSAAISFELNARGLNAINTTAAAAAAAAAAEAAEKTRV